MAVCTQRVTHWIAAASVAVSLCAALAGWGGVAQAAVQLPAAGTLELAFSPKEGAEQLILRVIDSSRREIRMLAYSLTSVTVVKALLAAKRRGVDIAIVADEKHNLGADASRNARAALAALASAGIEVRVIGSYAIHHDKVIISDREHVQLGSYNYSAAAANSNSENVMVNWSNPQLAAVYLRHFARNHAQASLYRPAY